MKIILIRPGSKDDENKAEDKDMPLSDEGRNDTRRLGSMLARLGLKPEVYIMSHYCFCKF